MLILLPPSETKRPGGDGVLDLGSLRGSTALGQARARVRSALESLSRDPEAAAGPLKLGKKNRHELAHNLALGTSGTMPAIERYTGVLYDALDVRTLADAEREWINEHVVIQSALFGLIAADDRIPSYRISASARLPKLGMPLKRLWSEAHRNFDWDREWQQAEFILDLRSKDYVALAPLPEGIGWFLNVTERGPDGQVRALNHFNKAAKGRLTRELARSFANIDGPLDFIDWASEHGLEVVGGPPGQLTLVTDRLGK